MRSVARHATRFTKESSHVDLVLVVERAPYVRRVRVENAHYVAPPVDDAEAAARTRTQRVRLPEEPLRIAPLISHAPVADDAPLAAREREALARVVDAVEACAAARLYFEARLVRLDGLAPPVHPVERRALAHIPLGKGGHQVYALARVLKGLDVLARGAVARRAVA